MQIAGVAQYYRIGLTRSLTQGSKGASVNSQKPTHNKIQSGHGVDPVIIRAQKVNTQSRITGDHQLEKSRLREKILTRMGHNQKSLTELSPADIKRIIDQVEAEIERRIAAAKDAADKKDSNKKVPGEASRNAAHNIERHDNKQGSKAALLSPTASAGEGINEENRIRDLFFNHKSVAEKMGLNLLSRSNLLITQSI